MHEASEGDAPHGRPPDLCSPDVRAAYDVCISQAGRHAGGPVDQDHVMDFVIRGEVCARFFELSGL